MRRTILGASVFVVAAACGNTVNPNVCCVTDEQCAALGIDEIRPCGPGQACGADSVCIAAECETNAQCDDARPVCRLGFCESTCTSDPDCAEVAGRTHCLESTCVGCIDSSQCDGTTAICDEEDHSCRGCERDSDCASGVCIEIDGVCADEARVVYAGGTGSAIAGECERTTPCKLDYALTKVRSSRDVIHFLSGVVSLPTSMISITSQVVLDGAPTMVIGGLTPDISVDGNSGALTLEGLVLRDVKVVSGTGGVRIHDVQGQGLDFSTTGGVLLIEKSDVGLGSRVSCMGGGNLQIRTSTFTNAPVQSTACTASIVRNRFFTDSSRPLAIMNGTAIVENSLFVTTSEATDMVYLIGGVGSVFRFNTLVSRSTIIDSAVAIYCDASIEITSNIFAYNSTNPISGNGPCTISASLFDLQGAGDSGTNLVGDHAQFFVDFTQGDFHLAPTCPGIDQGAPGLVLVDLDGTPRVASPDIGAYEAR